MVRLSGPAVDEMHKQKMTTLYKLVTGETQFKNKAPVKYSYITSTFGENWNTEVQQWFNSVYTSKMTPADKAEATKRFDKYLTRLNLTRYTASELAKYFSEGAHKVDTLAQADNVAQAQAFLKAKGADAFAAHVAAEAKNANWSAAQVAEFKKKVQSA
eukprot:TRINITY_DN43465_c0_g1_i1.p2 TRINITY_DN43465_c0_g1~~TRINITY_DN43465_c0_g1_i1.p2  ORF type:complete len:184 (+),score=93.87 TRINITY_DN43465_c0_g1_i1:80-553(+)